MKVFITGYGSFSAIGHNVQETLESLLAEKTGIKQGIQSYTKEFKVAEIDLSNEEIKSKFNISTEGSRTSLLGMVAAKEAFQGHEISDDIRTAVIAGTSVGGMDVSEKEYLKFYNDEPDNIEAYRHHPSGMVAEQIAEELGVSGFVNTISTACSSAANALLMGARMIQKGTIDRAIVGGTDSLTHFTVSGFNSLMILDKEWCRPFDESRKGLNLGEGAGFVVLESEASVKKNQSKVLARLSGWSNTSDAYHQTASSPDGKGAILSMTDALKVANLRPKDIDYINAHGTSTPNNDLSESKAILEVFNGKSPALSSTKAYTGHTLAASGGIEAVISILSIQNSCLFPNLNHRNVIEETGILPVQHVEKNKEVEHIMSNAFGFGGNNSTVIFSAT